MKRFFSTHSYNMVKMFLNQFATAIFGFALVLAAGSANNVFLRNASSVGAILFYMFLIYVMTWEIGYRDRVPVESGRMKKRPWTGSLISLCANLHNFIFAIFIALASLFNAPLLSRIGGVCSFLALTLEGMFTGLLANHVAGAPLNSYWFVYFLLPLPAILVSTVAYNMGLNDVKFTKIFDPITPESDRDPSERKKNHD